MENIGLMLMGRNGINVLVREYRRVTGEHVKMVSMITQNVRKCWCRSYTEWKEMMFVRAME